MAIALEPTYAYFYLGRADIYSMKGEDELAKEDYEKVIELDTIPVSYSYTQYAFMKLGQKEKSLEFINKIIGEDRDNAGNYYDAACLYAWLGEKEKAIEKLRIAL